MNRRDFLASVGGGSGLLAFAPGVISARHSPKGTEKPSLQGFIVSDAHFGWQHEQQPDPEEQREMMKRIMRRFPDLDLFIDTGDAHHGGASDEARGLWTDIIASGCGQLPFYYVPGNHEIVPPTGVDQEWRCNRLGSLSCRPYYSFDVKGVHFVSLPELERAVLVNRESVEWLALDLEVHKERTTIILSHNNILGTTTPFGEYGYRGIVNSPEMLELLDRYPNVIGWLHGHNHTYEVMEKHNRLYVSNGRIGGFVPPAQWGNVGQGHLGGIYFEISRDALTVLCYSATAEKFIGEVEDGEFWSVLERKTTFDPDAPVSYCYGYGGARDGQRIPVYHHHAYGQNKAEVFLTGVDGASFNEDPGFEYYMRRQIGDRGPHHQLMAATVQLDERWGEMYAENTAYEWLDPGVRLLARKSPDEFTRMTIPLMHQAKNAYLRCPPGRRYCAALDLESSGGGQRLQLTFKVHDRTLREVADIPGPVWTLEKGSQKKQTEVELPGLADLDCIYNDPAEDNAVHLMVLAEFTNMTTDVILRRFEVAFADAAGGTQNPGLVIDGKEFRHAGELLPGNVARIEVPAPTGQRTVYEPKAEGNRRVTWLVRHTAPDWQVRNAAVADKGDHLVVGPMRNTFSNSPEIVIVPTRPSGDPHVHRLRGVERASVYPLNRGNKVLEIAIGAAPSTCKIDIVSATRPIDVAGVESWAYEEGRVTVQAEQGSRIELKFK